MPRVVTRAKPRTPDLGLDLGSRNTVIAARQGVVFDEPTSIARTAAGRILAFGYEAAAMVGRSRPEVQVTRPMARGRLHDADLLHSYLSSAFALLSSHGIRWRTASIVASEGLTSEQRNMIGRIVKELGVAEARFIPEILADAVASIRDRDLDDPIAVIDVGSDITSFGLVRSGDVVRSESLEFGGSDLTNDLVKYVRRRYGLILATGQAESLLISLGCRGFRDHALSARIACKDAFSGRPSAHLLSATDVAEAIRPRVNEMTMAMKKFFDALSEADLRSLVDHGVDLNGGCALIPGFAEHLSEKLGLPMVLGGSPLHASAIGASQALIVPH